MTPDDDAPPRPPDPERLDAVLERIRSDRSLGSRQLNQQLLADLLEWSRGIDAIEPGQIRRLCERIRDLRPEMSAISQTGYRLRKQTRGDSSRLSPLELLRAGLETLEQQYGRVMDKMIDHLGEERLRDRRVLTFSRSGTILELIRTHPPIRSVTLLHAYPGGEGIPMARQLQGEVDQLTFAYDAEAGNLLPEVDALYLGADSLHDDGTVLNKIGSRLLASAARSTPVRVVVDSWKYTPSTGGSEAGPEVSSPEDLPETLRRNHPLFEPVPAHLIDTYITDRGVFHSPQHLHWKLDDLRRAHDQLP